jgi:hypothetical protein
MEVVGTFVCRVKDIGKGVWSAGFACEAQI